MNSTETKTELPEPANWAALTESTKKLFRLVAENDTLRTRLEAAEKANGELVGVLKDLLALSRDGSLLCSTFDNAKKVKGIEAQAMEILAAAEALKGEG